MATGCGDPPRQVTSGTRQIVIACSVRSGSITVTLHARLCVVSASMQREPERVDDPPNEVRALVREPRAKRRIEALLAASVPGAATRRTVVLCYHSVHPTSAIRSVTPEAFEQQIEWLQEHCDVVRYRSIPSLIVSSDADRPLVAITFDDGYEDNHRYALPILLAHHIPATLFVTTGLADQDASVIRRFARSWSVSEDHVRGLTWSQIAEMHAEGVDIGAHTRTHPVLSAMNDPEARNEIQSSKMTLEDHLGQEVSSFAYPFGKPRDHVSGASRRIVAEMGFGSAATILYRGVRPADDRFGIPRFPITRDSLDIYSAKIHGKLDAIGLWQTYAPRWLSNFISTDQSPLRASAAEAPHDIPVPPSSSEMLRPVLEPGSDWVALPWSRSPRWILPRGPSWQAKAGLGVYHPVTLRSRLGWEAARALAGRGAFRRLRGFGLIPNEMWEAAAPFVPRGGSLASAKANHPGRFHALVFDAEGRPVAVVKVARDTVGRLALATEREALDRFGAHLPPPLLAPVLLDHSDGVLVFRAMDWRARTFPWRLPEEVAFGIGTFFRRTSLDGSGDSGAAHGDFAPWNLLRTEDGWGLVDWENFRAEAPPYYDLFHFLIQSNAGLRRPRMQSILAGLNGEGWVGGLIRAYAEGSEVDLRDSAHFLQEYLRISKVVLGSDCTARGLRVRSKMASRVGG